MSNTNQTSFKFDKTRIKNEEYFILRFNKLKSGASSSIGMKISILSSKNHLPLMTKLQMISSK